MPVRGNPRSYYKKFAFVIEFDGVLNAGFQSCSELSAEIAVVEQWEGGAIKARKEPGRVTVPDLTLERGATDDLDLWEWFKLVANMATSTGAVDDEYKKDGEVIALNRDGSVRRRWALGGAWPNKFVAGAWDNTADENVIESVTLVIDDFEPLPG